MASASTNTNIKNTQSAASYSKSSEKKLQRNGRKVNFQSPIVSEGYAQNKKSVEVKSMLKMLQQQKQAPENSFVISGVQLKKMFGTDEIYEEP